MLRDKIRKRKNEEGSQPKNVIREKVALGEGGGSGKGRTWAISDVPPLRHSEWK